MLSRDEQIQAALTKVKHRWKFSWEMARLGDREAFAMLYRKFLHEAWEVFKDEPYAEIVAPYLREALGLKEGESK